MSEGKTNMFGKTYNTIGSTDSNFIIKTKGDLKVLWGNKYIDVIKNGKIASEGSKILFVVNSPDEIKLDGVYIITSTEGNELWVSIDGIKIQINNTSEETTYVSFLVELKATVELKHTALTNIGFYYETLSEAKAAHIVSGIIYVENDNKLYIAKNGILTEYITNISSSTSEEEEQKSKKDPLYIQDFSLWVDGIEYIRCTGDVIHTLKPITAYQKILSVNATEDKGYRLYVDDLGSVLEVDTIVWRKYPNPITYKGLLGMIEGKSLNPKMYYTLTDFQNPWEVTWNGEPFLYEDKYETIEEVEHLCGKRNAMQLIVKAKNDHEIEELVWSPLHPEWIIHYDPTYKGPEHKIMVGETEEVYYGFRTRTSEDGTLTFYLPCKGRITYLKDEHGNEGNFNFRLFMFKHNGGFWRYCVDKHVGNNTNYFGEFLECSGNTFNIDALEAFILVFVFTAVYDEEQNLVEYSLEAVDLNVQIQKGHHLYINGVTVNNNIFELKDYKTTYQHIILSDPILGNKFINIEGNIICSKPIKDNSFEKIKGDLTIETQCEGNTVIDIKESVIIKANTQFNKNYISEFDYWLDNNSVFVENTIKKCIGHITNNGTMKNNVFDIVNKSITNDSQLNGNIIKTIEELTNIGIVENNNISEIKSYLINEGSTLNNTIDILDKFSNKGIVSNNTFLTVEEFIVTNGSVSDNVIGYIKSLNNSGTISNNNIEQITESLTNVNGDITFNNITNIKTLTNEGNMSNNTIVDIISSLYNIGTINNNTISKIISDTTNRHELTNNSIESISNITIEANIINNTINNIENSTISGNVTNNKCLNIIDSIIENTMDNNEFSDIINSIFTENVNDNIIKATILDSTFGVFTSNIAYKTLTKFNFEEGFIDSCIFNKTITDFTVSNTIQSCVFNYINTLSLDKPVYYTTFHGSIGNITRELTDHEWDLLAATDKKTDAYPNIRVVCVPEIIKKGMILMWYGAEPIPKGWALCDGNNGTPNLIGSFIKGDSSTATKPTVPEGVDENTNEFTLKTIHLPKHLHPHKEHKHFFEETGVGLMYDDYATEGRSYTVYEGEGNSTVSGKGVSTSSELETIVVSVSGYTSSVPSEEDDWQYNNPPTPIKLEPKHFKLIFIMKIDDNPEES